MHSNNVPLPYLVVFASLVGVAACGGESNTGPSPATPPPPPAPPPPPSPSTGSIRVTTTSAGEDLDLSAYVAAVGQDRRRMDLDGVVAFSLLPAGDYFVDLDDVAGNCSVSGGAARQVTVTAGNATEVAFDVSCEALPPAEVDVTGTWVGTYIAIDPETLQEVSGIPGTLTYVLEQTGDDVTASTIQYSGPAFEGVGRVSGSTFTLFFLGRETSQGLGRMNAMLEVSGDEMVGSEREQLDDWAANTELTRQ